MSVVVRGNRVLMRGSSMRGRGGLRSGGEYREEDRLLGSLMSEGSGFGSLFALNVMPEDSEKEGEGAGGSAFSSSGWVEVNEK